MAITEREAVAGLRILICVAKADGVLHEGERAALERALEGVALPAGVDLDAFLDEPANLEEQARALQSDLARERVFQSACGIAFADGECSPEELHVLELVREALGISEERAQEVRRVFERSDDDDPAAGAFAFIEDADARKAAIDKETLKCAVWSAVFGAFPLPGVAVLTDLAVVAFQVSLVRHVGAMWGHPVDKRRARSLLAGLGVGTAPRIAVSNLTKLLPGWGSVVGATTSFASSYAVGTVADAHFASGGEGDIGGLKETFERAQKDGRHVYAANKAEIETTEREARDSMERLSVEVKAGRLSRFDYEARAVQLQDEVPESPPSRK